ncbi:hypothetical protein [Zoogloea sp.]|uniref:hypothetical protein n=1 Tax=Zoogloea sp. TaxID=49181 RepID=UPI00263306C9|nr:hypothetical protein [uncultured Zoogloea sp.]
MSQNIVSISLTGDDLTAIRGMLAGLEEKLKAMVELTAAQRLELVKMGPTSESFVRQSLATLEQDPDILPRSFNLEEMQRDLRALDELRPIFSRLRQLGGRAADTERALGSDLYSAALAAYRFAKAAEGSAVADELVEHGSERFAATGKRNPAPEKTPD